MSAHRFEPGRAGRCARCGCAQAAAIHGTDAQTPQTPQTPQTLIDRIKALSADERSWVLYWLAQDADPGLRAVLGDALDRQHIVAQKQRSG